MDISIICPFVKEWPQIVWTIQNLREQLVSGNLHGEIILVNNYCSEVEQQAGEDDKAAKYIEGLIEGGHNELVLLEYKEKLSHWNAKQFAVEHAKADTLLFVDAHVYFPHKRIKKAFREFHLQTNTVRDGGSLHFPLAYMNDHEKNSLLYRLRFSPDLGMAHYVFHKKDTRGEKKLFTVPCASSCGMMIDKSLFLEKLGGFPKALGIYGGGENFVNFTLAVLGYQKFISPGPPLFHYGEKRGYRWNHLDWLKNRLIAAYLSGGESWAHRCIEGMIQWQKIGSRGARIMLEEVLYNPDLEKHRALIRENARVTLEDWSRSWEGSDFYEEVYEWK